MGDKPALTGELVVRFYDNGHIELDDVKAQRVRIGDLYKVGRLLHGLGDFINPVDKLVIDNEEAGSDADR